MILFAVHFPDIEKAEKYDKEFEEYFRNGGHTDLHSQLNLIPTYIDYYFENMTCKQSAMTMRTWLIQIALVHALCFGVNVFREIYETKLGFLGRLMRGFEVVGLGSYILSMIQALENISVFLYWQNMKHLYPD